MYNYQTERAELFTDEGQRMFLKIRDNVDDLLNTAGAFKCDKALDGVTGSSWQMLACLDRLVELGEIRKLIDSAGNWGQDQVYVRVQRNA